jgi:hypothetical protein
MAPAPAPATAAANAQEPVFRSRFLTIGNGQIDGIPPSDLTYANVRDGKVKYKTIRKSKLLLLCTNLLDHIKDLELRHEEELKEAKVEEAKVEKEAAPTGDDVDDGTNTSNGEAGEEDVMGVEEDVKVNTTSNKSKSAKLAKLVKLVNSTSLWCLSPHVPLSQEARDKDKQRQRKVCPVNLRGEVCTADNCGSKHPQVCLVADHGKRKIPKSTCILWHMRIPRENPTGNNISNNNARPAMPDDKYLARLEAECRAEELKARIRATKMMLQGISYSQMVEGPPHRVPAHVAQRAVRTALTPDGAIAILEDAVERLRLLLS